MADLILTEALKAAPIVEEVVKAVAPEAEKLAGGEIAKIHARIDALETEIKAHITKIIHALNGQGVGTDVTGEAPNTIEPATPVSAMPNSV